MAPNPLHTHDCNCCEYHGTVKDSSGQFVDLYTCRGVTAVVRYGSDGPEYTSMPLALLKEGGEIAGSMLYVVLVLSEQEK
jgi:hypothetical protein